MNYQEQQVPLFVPKIFFVPSLHNRRDTCGTFCPIIWHRQLFLVISNETRPIKAVSQSSGVLPVRTRTPRLELDTNNGIGHRNQHAARLPSRLKLIKMQAM